MIGGWIGLGTGGNIVGGTVVDGVVVSVAFMFLCGCSYLVFESLIGLPYSSDGECGIKQKLPLGACRRPHCAC